MLVRHSSRHAARAITALVASFTLGACKGEPVDATAPTGRETFQPYTFAFTEPAGDTVAAAAGTAGRATDLIGIAGRVEETYVDLTLTFAQPVLRWSSGAATALDGFVDFDMDENAATGVPGAADEFGGVSAMGAEAYISLRDDGAGHVAVRDVSQASFSWVAANFAGSTVTIRIPRAYLTRPTAESFRVSAVVGNHDRPATDFAPDSGYFRVTR